MNPTKLRGFLTFFLLIVISSGVAVYYFAFAELRTFSVEVGHRVTDANASAEQIQNL